ncbi:hypothetical protein [Flavobacterium psychraquaticum]|uniref:hypothetical protein n=1 Tax=Flavobacterium psychraquaticum TaxID=3103958 RepID=UPI002ACE1ECC|nr:hypothetical protein [Flavobacterium sp. LB-N7T]
MNFFKYKTVRLLIVAIVLALVAIPFENENVILLLRLSSFAIIMYVIVKLTSVKKSVKK